ncbi:MAG: acyl-ACP--UDP-N-acetylglucosamine O-acyltransferase [Alphaproteobacteria bacterium]|nr:acyl-ACP--UDP-N-acetylglucosamine O-acyltransferase [Alphaproteobacteria bacterium]
MTDIHKTAIVDKKASVGDGVTIGPYCVVGAQVTLEDGVTLKPHVVVDGRTTIGAGTQIYPFASIGLAPQDLKYRGEASRLVVGRNNVIREYVTMNPGTEGGGMETRIGDDGLYMIGVHVAHDCRVGNGVIMANNATLAGHVTVDDFAVIGGLAAVHQFVRIGSHAMIGGLSGVEQDVIPFGSVTGERASLSGLNIVGMKRRGFDREVIHGLRSAFKGIFDERGTLGERVDSVAGEYPGNAAVEQVVEFIRGKSTRGLTRPKSENDG